MTEVTNKTKSQIAVEVYAKLQEEGRLSRKAFIEEMTKNHNMTPAGASTYYVNTKTKAEGGKVKSYYKSKSQRSSSSGSSSSTPSNRVSDDVTENTSLFSIAVVAAGQVESVHGFTSAESLIERYNKLKPENRSKCLMVHGAPEVGTPVDQLKLLDPNNNEQKED